MGRRIINTVLLSQRKQLYRNIARTWGKFRCAFIFRRFFSLVLRQQNVKRDFRVGFGDDVDIYMSWIVDCCRFCHRWTTPDDTLSTLWYSRHAKLNQFLNNEAKSKWINLTFSPFFLASAIAIDMFMDSGHYRHLIHVQISKKRIIPLTHGRYDVNKIVHWDQTNNLVWVIPVNLESSDE